MSNVLKMIALTQLQHSKTNVRKTDKAADIAQLAASIAAHGLLENLVVSRANANGDAKFDVIAGGRRLAALKLLAKRKVIAPDLLIPCAVRKPNGASLAELSLAENLERAPLHPADQFEAFAKLCAKGQTADEIAVRFGLTATLVAQRLKLACVSPRLIAAYRKAEMTLEQLMAFAISDDHTAQEEFWFELLYADRSPHSIRRFLTKAHVGGHDRRARFIGIRAYEEAGGTIVRDLFDAEDEGYFADSQLLDRLVSERLSAEASRIQEEGWKWVEITSDPDAVRMSGLSVARMDEVMLSKKDERRLARLAVRYDDLVAELEEADGPASEELESVAAELSALQAKKEVWPDDEKVRAGVLISLNRHGAVEVARGLVRGEDREESEVETGAGSHKESAKQPLPYSESLILDLSAHRTAALREVLASKPELAFTALLVVLASDIVLNDRAQGCLGIVAQCADLDRASKSVEESSAARAFALRCDEWRDKLSRGDDLWDCLTALNNTERLSLLAHCISSTVNAVWSRADAGRLAGAERLAQRLSLDMADWWRPTRDNFLSSIKKEQIAAAVSEALSPFEARRLTGLKKPDMAERAEALLAKTRWLPEFLRPAII